MEATTPFVLGQRAFDCGKEENENPYDIMKETESYFEWKRGWELNYELYFNWG